MRIGTAEIYRAVEMLDGIADSLIVCCEWPDGTFFMPLFVRLAEASTLDDALGARIRRHLRETCSPRHVPDAIRAVPAIPYTLTGKKMEVPVRRLLMGEPLGKVASPESMADRTALGWYERYAVELAQGRQAIASGGRAPASAERKAV